MRFLESLYKSVYDLTWLKLQRNNPKKAWGYFALLAVMVSVLWLVPDIFKVPGTVKELRENVVKEVPEFQATLKGGVLSVANLPQPYVLKDSGYVLVVDTVSTDTPALASYLSGENASGVLISRKAIETYDDSRGQSRSQDFAQIPDGSFNRSDLVSVAQKILSPGSTVLLIIIMVLVSYVIVFVGKLISIVIIAFLVKIIARIMGRHWMFGELFTVGLFAVTLPSFINLIAAWSGAYIPYLHSLALFAFLLAMVITKDEAAMVEPKDHDTM